MKRRSSTRHHSVCKTDDEDIENEIDQQIETMFQAKIIHELLNSAAASAGLTTLPGAPVPSATEKLKLAKKFASKINTAKNLDAEAKGRDATYRRGYTEGSWTDQSDYGEIFIYLFIYLFIYFTSKIYFYFIIFFCNNLKSNFLLIKYGSFLQAKAVAEQQDFLLPLLCLNDYGIDKVNNSTIGCR